MDLNLLNTLLFIHFKKRRKIILFSHVARSIQYVICTLYVQFLSFNSNGKILNTSHLNARILRSNAAKNSSTPSLPGVNAKAGSVLWHSIFRSAIEFENRCSNWCRHLFACCLCIYFFGLYFIYLLQSFQLNANINVGLFLPRSKRHFGWISFSLFRFIISVGSLFTTLNIALVVVLRTFFYLFCVNRIEI